jgi:formylglycine-generating enzyme required for sulfatase activity
MPSWLKAEGPRHEVTITKAFHMGVFEVTQEEYEKVMSKNPSYFSSTGGGKDKVSGSTRTFPVETVSWEDADEFCKKLTALAAEKKAGRQYRLPTEAEWEYACRGGDSSHIFYTSKTGSDSLSSAEANFHGNYPYGGSPKEEYKARTCKVGSYKANKFVLFDMHGNVLEWCQDYFDEKVYEEKDKRDPQSLKLSKYRVLRGGSWFSDGYDCRAAYR